MNLLEVKFQLIENDEDYLVNVIIIIFWFFTFLQLRKKNMILSTSLAQSTQPFIAINTSYLNMLSD